ncbi:MAG: hypothetical protein ABI777_13540 [Betaproteobacteria bacterium]
MHLTLFLPSLLAAPRDALIASPALAAMARRALPPEYVAGGLAAALLAVAGVPPDTPLAPVAARGAGVDIGTDAIARADPIALVAGRDNVLLNGRVDDVSAADTQAILDRMNTHFADDGLVFFAPRPDTWFVRLIGIDPPQTTSLARVHGAIHGHLPRGIAAGRWKRWMSEMQMLLHDDPRNAARERNGQMPVTGLWIADAGPAVTTAGDASRRWFAPAGRDGDVARGLAPMGPGSVSSPPATFALMPPGADAIVILPPLRSAADVHAAMTAWLAPTLAAQDNATLAGLSVIADDGRGAFTYSPRAESWWSRWRASARRQVFAPPTTPEPA